MKQSLQAESTRISSGISPSIRGPRSSQREHISVSYQLSSRQQKTQLVWLNCHYISRLVAQQSGNLQYITSKLIKDVSSDSDMYCLITDVQPQKRKGIVQIPELKWGQRGHGATRECEGREGFFAAARCSVTFNLTLSRASRAQNGKPKFFHFTL